MSLEFVGEDVSILYQPTMQTEGPLYTPYIFRLALCLPVHALNETFRVINN